MNGKKSGGKRTLSLTLAVLMVLTIGQGQFLSGTVYAQEASESPAPKEEMTAAGETQTCVPDASGVSSSDELFAGYAMQVFYGDSGISLLSNYGETALDGYNLFLYREIKEKVKEIAANGGSTEFTVTLDEPITWKSTAVTNEQLGQEAAKAYAEAGIDTKSMLDCLLADCPYELYWFDKTSGMTSGYTSSASGGTGSISKLSFSLFVVSDYQDSNDSSVNPEKAKAASNAARTAQQIAVEHANDSDYAKMLAFKEKICELADYNHDAADQDYTGGFGDPWQMIYVFDNDPDTKVVCEGYSKAFQYLCDLSGLTCYTVTGNMNGGTGEGRHMWNIVTLSGKNYLVDVTNSDSGTAGQGGELFLAGRDSGSWNTTYNFNTEHNMLISYTYDADQKSLYGEDILTLAENDYSPAGQEAQAQVNITGPENGKVPYGTAPVLRVTVTGPEGSERDISYQWYQVNEYGTAQAVSGADEAEFAPSELGLGSYTYYCLVVCDGYEITSGQFTVTVEQAVLTPSITGKFTKIYDGSMDVTAAQELGISLNGAVPGEDVSASASAYKYNSKDVLAADTITATGIALSGDDSGNYRLAADTASVAGSIAPCPVTVTPDSGQYKVQGAPDPVLTYRITTGSLAAGETLSGELSRLSGETAGDYEITIGTLGTQNPNYEITLGESAVFEIRPGTDLSQADVTVNGSYTYNGGAQIPDLTVVLAGQTLIKDTDYTVAAKDNTNAGTAQYTITGKGNYSGTKSGTFEISKAEPIYKAPQGLTAEYGTALSEISLTNPSGNTLGAWEWKDGNAEVDKVGEKTYTAVFTPADTLNYTSPHEVRVTVTGTDSVAPTGEITVGNSRWREFLNTITFGHFFKDTQDVVIEGQDNTGTDITIYYVLSESGLTKEELRGLGENDWTVYEDKFSISPNRKVIVYARITDASGNSSIISSNGIVLYTDAAAVTDQIEYTRTGASDVTAQVNLNGNTVAGIRNGSTQLAEDTDYSVGADGTITFKADYLKTLSAGSYTLTVSYRPMGMEYEPAAESGSQAPAETDISLTVNKLAGSVSGISDLSKIYDSEPAGVPSYNVTGTGSVSVEYKRRDADDSSYTAEAPEDAGEYTVRVSVAENEDYTAASGTAYFTVSRRETAITGAAAAGTKVYDGTVSAEVTAPGTLSDAIAGDSVQIRAGTASYADKNTGTGKAVTFTGFSLTGGDALNYRLTGQPAGVTADITPKELTVEVAVADKVFDGTTDARIESASLTGVVTGDEVTLQNGTASFTSSDVGTNIPVTFTAFSISGRDAGNYTLVQPTGVTADIASYAAQEGTDYTVNSNEWINSDFVVTAGDNRLLSAVITAEDNGWTETLTVSRETADGSLTFYVKNTQTGAVSTAVTVTYKIDKTAPEGSVSVGGQTWTGLQDDISFENFFDDSVEVNITASDTLSSMASVEYFVSADVLDREELEETEDWTSVSDMKLSLDSEGRHIVYVKLTDQAGNINYLSTDGIVLDKTDPVISGIENGEVYYGSAVFAAADEYLDTVTVDGQAVTIPEGGYTIQADNAEHTVTAADKAGNETTCVIGVYRVYPVILPDDAVGYTVRSDVSEVRYNGSYTFSVELADGYSKTEHFAVKVNGTAVEPQADGSYLVSGVQADQIVTAEGVEDITVPSAEIRVAENSWRNILHTITFGLFFNETQTVEITASDPGSGMDTLQYYVSREPMDAESLFGLTDWKSYDGAFSIDQEDTYVIYVKAKDNDGNAVYISSDGMVLDFTAPVFNGLTDGQTYYGEVSFEAEDTYLDRVEVDGQRAEPGEDGYTVRADDKTHTVTAYDRAGNSRSCTVNVYNNYTVTFVADGEIVKTMTVGFGDSVSSDQYPEIPEKAGYTETPPRWSPASLENIAGDVTVTAVYFPDGEEVEPQPGENPEGDVPQPGADTDKGAGTENTVKAPQTGDSGMSALLWAAVLCGGLTVTGIAVNVKKSTGKKPPKTS